MSDEQRRLSRIFKQLAPPARRSLLDFAQFLLDKQGPLQEDGAREPVPHPRPERETVVGALKRLKATYPMLETDVLFNDASALMAQHIVQGREAAEVIDELEGLFASHYKNWK